MRKLLKGLPDRIVRLLAEMRVEILWHNTPDNKNPFVSLRRRELKYPAKINITTGVNVRLLAET